MTSNPYRVTYGGETARLDRVLVSELGEVFQCSRSQVERWIEDGRVKIDGKIVTKPAYKVESGDEIELAIVERSASELAPFAFELSILHEDSDLIVVNKPAGLSMHPGAGNRERTLANAIVNHVGRQQLSVGDSDRPGIVHRLDKDTTGVVVVAKSTPIHAVLAKQFAERSIGRTYRALVFTTPRAKRPIQQNDQGEVSAPIGRHPTRRKMMAIVEGGKPACTQWQVLERFSYGTLIECRLQTGRTHQIRVHMASIGSPVIGDKTYGDFSNVPQKLRDAAEHFGRQALHAATLTFTHPRTGDRLSFSAPIPDDFAELINLFRAAR